MMNHKEGDRVRIQSREWLNEQDKLSSGDIRLKDGSHFIETMLEYAGKIATITKITGNDEYDLDIDNGECWWTDYMFDPDYNPESADEPLPPEDAARAMLNGEILFNKEGEEHYWGTAIIDGKERKDFIASQKGFRLLSSFDNLYRNIPKRTRPMTNDEAIAWVKSDESLGWMVRCSFQNWDFPRIFGYHGNIKSYQRARMLPDLSGIDESTIQGFEVKE
jgi:hypothetical protein